MFRSYRYIRPRLSDKNFWLVSWNIISIILRNNSCLSLIHPIKLNLNTNLWYKFNYSQHSTSLRNYQKTHSIKNYIHISFALNWVFHNCVGYSTSILFYYSPLPTGCSISNILQQVDLTGLTIWSIISYSSWAIMEILII